MMTISYSLIDAEIQKIPLEIREVIKRILREHPGMMLLEVEHRFRYYPAQPSQPANDNCSTCDVLPGDDPGDHNDSHVKAALRFSWSTSAVSRRQR